MVALQVSAFVGQSVVAFKHEHAGCNGSSVKFKHILPVSQGSNVGTLKLHSHFGGIAVILQLSAVSAIQSDESKHEHAGWLGSAVVFIQPRPTSQTSKFVFELHSHVAGVVVLLQVSALSRHWSSLKHEQAGCPTSSVIFRQYLPVSQGMNVGELELHSHVGGETVLLQVSEVFPKQSEVSKHEHAGWSGVNVVLRQVLLASQGANVGELLLHKQVGGTAVALQVSDVFPKQSVASIQEHAG